MIITAVVFALAAASAPQTSQPPAPAPAPPFAQTPAVPDAGIDRQAQPPAAPDYQIGPQDAIKITVYDADGLNGEYRVDNDGFISFALLGRIGVGGLTLQAVQEKLRTLLANGYIRNPQVRVDIQEYKSQSIFVSGEVRSPAELRMTGGDDAAQSAGAGRLADVVGQQHPDDRATEEAGRPARADASDVSDVMTVNWRDLQVGKAADIPLQDGDVIFVPEGADVLHPGLRAQRRQLRARAWHDGRTGDRARRRPHRARQQSRHQSHAPLNGKTIEIALNLYDKVQAGDVITIKQRLF